MFSMLHPGWLLLLICTVILFLVGCSILPSRTPVPSATAPLNITLTVYPLMTESPQPRSTRPATSVTLVTDAINNPRITPPPDEDLYVEAPLCTSTHTGFVCLGRVWNYGDYPAYDVTLRVLLRDEDELLERYYSVEQRLIPPGNFAPYRIQFSTGQFEAVQGASSLSSEPHLAAAITIVDERGIYHDNGRYVITSSLRNDTNLVIHSIRTVATVVDEWDQVVGYRIQDRNQILNVGENIIIRLEILPQVGEIFQHHLHAEGYYVQ